MTRQSALELVDVSYEYPTSSVDLATLLTLRVTKNLRPKSVSNVSLNILKGERIALLGSNGSGKTTLLRLLAGIITPSEGLVRSNSSVYPLLYNGFFTTRELTVEQSIIAHHKYQKLYKHLHINSYLESVLSFSGLHNHRTKAVKKLSAGMTVRLLFALLLDGTHEVIAMDEFFGTGDQTFFANAKSRLSDYLGSTGTLILASHNTDLLEQFCTRGLVMQGSRLVFDGPLSQAIAFHNNDY